jgi:hypothetical protein
MRLFFYILLSLSFSFSTRAQGYVTEIESSGIIFADQMDRYMFKEGDQVLFASKKDKNILGFGKIKKLGENLENDPGQVEILEIIQHSLIGVGDIVYPMNVEVIEKLKVPGFNSLTLGGDSHIPSKYKELVYFGVFTSEGHTLDEKEVLISPFQIQYGVQNDFGIKIVSALFFDGYANGGLKYRLMRNKYAKITLDTLVGYKLNGNEDWIWQLGGVVTTVSNAKFQNHLIFNFTMDKQFMNAKATEDLGLYQDSDVRSITEYITDEWNRVLFGPTYNIQLQTFGGTLSYMWIWNSFHTSLGMATKDFTNLSFGKEGYYYVYDIF